MAAAQTGGVWRLSAVADTLAGRQKIAHISAINPGGAPGDGLEIKVGGSGGIVWFHTTDVLPNDTTEIFTGLPVDISDLYVSTIAATVELNVVVL
jgi:hypothetical protein